ncbi:BRO-N domain-containing protein [Chitinimonas sp. PSY-7]|uniref:BRO family protein n=1 Tax=Chitinimonas sp. PSY-7 TaxID=3459088 RepID=UPI00403FFB30
MSTSVLGASAPQLYSFQVQSEGWNIRSLLINGDPWFVAVDVCRALALLNPSKAVISLDSDEKMVSSAEWFSDPNLKLGSAGNGPQSLNLVNESGLYTLILRCRDAVKPGTVAHRFRKWVTSEVLPSIRKQGTYQHTGNAGFSPEQLSAIHAHHQVMLQCFEHYRQPEMENKLWEGIREQFGPLEEIPASAFAEVLVKLSQIAIDEPFSKDWISFHDNVAQMYIQYVRKDGRMEGYEIKPDSIIVTKEWLSNMREWFASVARQQADVVAVFDARIGRASLPI